LLGEMSIKETKELITGKYFMKHRNSVEMKKLHVMARFFQQNGWGINAMCYCIMYGGIIRDYFLWNLPIIYFVDWLINTNNLILTYLAIITFILFIVTFDAIPHLTTAGY